MLSLRKRGSIAHAPQLLQGASSRRAGCSHMWISPVCVVFEGVFILIVYVAGVRSGPRPCTRENDIAIHDGAVNLGSAGTPQHNRCPKGLPVVPTAPVLDNCTLYCVENVARFVHSCVCTPQCTLHTHTVMSHLFITRMTKVVRFPFPFEVLFIHGVRIINRTRCMKV